MGKGDAGRGSAGEAGLTEGGAGQDGDGGSEAGDAPPPCVLDGSLADQCPSLGATCCAGSCVDEQTDTINCGGCGTVCSGLNSACRAGNCQAP